MLQYFFRIQTATDVEHNAANFMYNLSSNIDPKIKKSFTSSKKHETYFSCRMQCRSRRRQLYYIWCCAYTREANQRQNTMQPIIPQSTFSTIMRWAKKHQGWLKLTRLCMSSQSNGKQWSRYYFLLLENFISCTSIPMTLSHIGAQMQLYLTKLRTNFEG